MMERLNRDGTFTNRGDDLDGLKTQLDQRFGALTPCSLTLHCGAVHGRRHRDRLRPPR